MSEQVRRSSFESQSQDQNESIPVRRREVSQELQTLEAESLKESLPEGFPSDADNKFLKPIQKVVKHKDTTTTLLNIVHGAFWGVLARKGLMALTTYNGSYLSGVIWANFAACLVMGMMVESTTMWIEVIKLDEFDNKGAIPFYVGITTGFCGTCSSFSSAILEIFNEATNTSPNGVFKYPTAGYGVMEFLAVMIAQFGLSLNGLFFGRHIVRAIDEKIFKFTKDSLYSVHLISIFMSIAGIVVVCVLLGVKKSTTWRDWMFSCFFAPFGAILRFYLSKFFNTRIKGFPLGTFLANVIGTLLLAVFTLLSRGKAPGSKRPLVTNPQGIEVLHGLEDGFCGALTTVSTFVVELSGLRLLHAYIYFTASVTVSFLLTVFVLGLYNWIVGITY